MRNSLQDIRHNNIKHICYLCSKWTGWENIFQFLYWLFFYFLYWRRRFMLYSTQTGWIAKHPISISMNFSILVLFAILLFRLQPHPLSRNTISAFFLHRLFPFFAHKMKYFRLQNISFLSARLLFADWVSVNVFSFNFIFWVCINIIL